MENRSISDELLMTVSLHTYQSKVFILPPWEEIYETDSELNKQQKNLKK